MKKLQKTLFILIYTIFMMTAGWAADFIWTGNSSSDFTVPGNWDVDGTAAANAPSSTDNVTIPFGVGNMPVITGSEEDMLDLKINKLTLQKNTSLTLVLKNGTVNFTCTNGIISESGSPGATPGKVFVQHTSTTPGEGSGTQPLVSLVKPSGVSGAKITLTEEQPSNKRRTVTLRNIQSVEDAVIEPSPWSGDICELKLNSEIKIEKSLNNKGTSTNNGTFNANGNTVSFGGYAGSPAKVEGSGNTNFAGLTLPYHTAVHLSGENITVSGQINNNGEITSDVSSKVTFTGTGASVTSSGSASFANVTIASGGVLHLSQSINISGNLENNGTFANGINNTVTFTGDNSQITGTGATAFYNLTIANGKKCTFNRDITITHTLNNGGTFEPASGATSKTVIFDGNDCKITGNRVTTFENLTINSGKKLTLEQDIKISKALTNNGTFNANGKTVTLVPDAASPPSNTVTVTGTSGAHADTSFNKLQLTGAGGKTLKIVNNIKVSDLYISGTSDTLGQRLIVRGSGKIELTNTHTPNNGSPKKGYYLEVQSDIPIKTGSKFYITESVVTGSANWEIPSSLKIWNGNAGDQNWGTAANWDSGTVPSTNSLVIIPQLTGSSTNYPKLTNNTARARVVEIKSGAFLDLADLVISSDSTWSVRPKLIVEGTLKLTGTAVQKNWFPDPSSSVPEPDNKIILKSGSTVEYYGSTNNDVWEGPYEKLKISGTRNNLTAQELTVNKDLITDHTGVTITTTKGQAYHGNVQAFEGASYYQLTLTNTGTGTTGTIKTSNTVTTGNLTVNGQWKTGDQNNSANVRVTGNLTVNGNWELGHNNKASAVHTSGNITVTGNWNSYRSSVTASGTGNITANTLNTEWRCWGDITAEGNIQVRKMTASGGTIEVRGNMTANTFHLADWGKLYFKGSGSQSLTFTDTAGSQIRELEIGSSSILNLASPIKITHILTNKGKFAAGNHTVTLSKANRIDNSDPNTVPPTSITITGTSTAGDTEFEDLICTDSYIKTLTINNNISVTGSLKLEGQSAASPLTVAGGTSVGTGSPHIALTAANTAKGQFLNVETDIAITGGPPVNPYTYTAENSIPIGSYSDIQAGKPDNWIFTNYGALEWAGTVDSDWHNRRNWNPPLAVPGKDTVVTIPRKPSPDPPYHDYPKLTKAGEAKSITIAEKASLDLAGFVITKGAGADNFTPLTNNGTLKMTGTTYPSPAPLGGQKEWLASTNVANKITHGNKSAIEYYGTSADVVWKGPYKNLILNSRPNLNIQNENLVVEKKLTITGSPAHINTGTGTQKYQGEIDAKKSAVPHWNIEFTASSLTMEKGEDTLNINAEDIKVNAGTWTSSANINAASITASGSWTTKKGNINLRGGLSAGSFEQEKGTLTLGGSGGTLKYTSSPGTAKIKNLVIASSAAVNLGSDIIITEKFENKGTFNAGTHTVTLEHAPAPAVNRTIQIIGNADKDKTKFHTLKCNLSGATSKNIRFEGNVSVYGNLTLRGASDTVSLDISGTKEIEKPVGAPNPEHSGTIYINGNKSTTDNLDSCKWLKIATNLPIKSLNSNENLYKCTAYKSIYAGNFEDILPLLIAGHPKNWVFGDVDRLAWTGEANDNNWNNPGNWRPRQSAAPNGNQYVIVRNNASGSLPKLGSGTYRAKEVEVRGNVTLDLGESVIFTGSAGSNTAKLTTAGTLKLKGTLTQKNWFEAANGANKIHLDGGEHKIIYYNDSTVAEDINIWEGPYNKLEVEKGKLNIESKTGTTPNTIKAKEFTVQTLAEVKLKSDMKINSQFTNNGTFDATSSDTTGYTVTLGDTNYITISGTGDAGKTKFHNLSCENAGGKTLKILNKITVAGALTLSGTSGSSPAFLTITGPDSGNSEIHLKTAQSPDGARGSYLQIDTGKVAIKGTGVIFYVVDKSSNIGGKFSSENGWIFLKDGLNIVNSFAKPGDSHIYLLFNHTELTKDEFAALGENAFQIIAPGKNTYASKLQSNDVVKVDAGKVPEGHSLWKITINKDTDPSKNTIQADDILHQPYRVQLKYFHTDYNITKNHISDIGIGMVKPLKAFNSTVLYNFDTDSNPPLTTLDITIPTEAKGTTGIPKLYFISVSASAPNKFWYPNTMQEPASMPPKPLPLPTLPTPEPYPPGTNILYHFATRLTEAAKDYTGIQTGGLLNFIIPETDLYIHKGKIGQFIYVYDGWLPCVRLKGTDSNPDNNILSFDVWNFRIVGVQKQRGGASIFDNVVNPHKGQSATIAAHLKKPGKLTIQIMTLDGNVVRTLERSYKPAGDHFVTWDGRNNGGNPVASGMYFVRIAGPEIDEVRKILVIK
ncbi:hypothetical protein E4O05_01985 [Treponema sp. OMZ 787]|uniref:FlgD immunoglobulin-like domain containing protein n=1 Tax=Treponema sp. OMZ 787 TaxID=2563669 RepID=UPI0020A3B039|nr:FlgD immunoglobulin-like domain containing protein [Treponema sp. OMZ 787]UTC62693.1 hypothetical protein E4O05_01985 [Treponema sp. OMZ 787]